MRLKGQKNHSGASLTCTSPRLLDLVDKQTLKRLLTAFFNATGLRANVVDISGKSIYARKMQFQMQHPEKPESIGTT